MPTTLEELIGEEDARLTLRTRRLAERDSALAEYEAVYGQGLDRTLWHGPPAFAPYPASIRARRLALALWARQGPFARDLALAARAVLLQPELHLLGNHLLENGIALACAGCALEGTEPDLWWAAGVRILEWQLDRQFLPDGGHAERSASYHCGLTAALLELVLMARAAGRVVPEQWEPVIARAVQWLVDVRAPDGTYPLFNDAALDAAPSIARVLSLGRAAGFEHAPRAQGPSRLLTSTGWLFLENERVMAVVDVGVDAWGEQPGHAHADGLTFELWVDGKRCVVDYGIEQYAPGEGRDRTRSTRSHNTVTVGDVDSAEVWAAFRLGRRSVARIVSLEDRSPSTVAVTVEHDGYRHVRGGQHTRRMELRPDALEITDTVAGASGLRVESRLRLDDSSTVHVNGDPSPIVRESVWFPEHGVARSARVCTMNAVAPCTTKWVVNWN